MTNSILKPIVKVGNGAGVVLPRSWYGGTARVELIDKPINIREDVFEILGDYFNSIMGIYLVGSYARGEEKYGSDVDILVITSDVNHKINNGKYEVILISRDNLENSLKKNVLPMLPMLKEAKVILNKNLILDYKKTPLTKENMKWHIETTKSSIKVCESSIEIDKEKSDKTDDSVAYSLILRAREVYLVDCMIKNKMWSNKEFLNLIKKISGSLKSYEGYLRVKKKQKSLEELPIEEAVKLIDYISKKITEHEEWAIKRK